MIKVSIYYPNKEGGKFDMDYYLHTHMPMSIAKQGSALKSASIDIRINGGPGLTLSHLMLLYAICYMKQ